MNLFQKRSWKLQTNSFIKINSVYLYFFTTLPICSPERCLVLYIDFLQRFCIKLTNLFSGSPQQRNTIEIQSKINMSATTQTIMTPTLPMETAPAKVVKKRGPKKKAAKEAEKPAKEVEKPTKEAEDKTDKNIPSEQNQDNSEEDKQETTTKKTRAPTLSANNKRFVQFTYFLLNKLKDTNPEIDTTPLYDTFKVFDTVENQLLFLNTFDQDAVKSSMKKHKADLKKNQLDFNKIEKKLATKIKRTKNVSPFYEDNTLVSITFNGADAVDDPKLLSSLLVLDALKLKNSNLTQTQTQPDIVAQIVNAANDHNKDHNKDHNDHDTLDVQLCKIHDKSFLIDNNNNLYHPDNHTLLATFNPNDNSILYKNNLLN